MPIDFNYVETRPALSLLRKLGLSNILDLMQKVKLILIEDKQ